MKKITLKELRERYPVFQGEVKLLRIGIDLKICEDLKCTYEEIEDAIKEYVSQEDYQKLDKRRGQRYNLDGSVYGSSTVPKTWEECIAKWRSSPKVPDIAIAKQLSVFSKVKKLPELMNLMPLPLQKELKRRSMVNTEKRKERKRLKNEAKKS